MHYINCFYFYFQLPCSKSQLKRFLIIRFALLLIIIPTLYHYNIGPPGRLRRYLNRISIAGIETLLLLLPILHCDNVINFYLCIGWGFTILNFKCNRGLYALVLTRQNTELYYYSTILRFWAERDTYTLDRRMTRDQYNLWDKLDYDYVIMLIRLNLSSDKPKTTGLVSN